MKYCRLYLKIIILIGIYLIEPINKIIQAMDSITHPNKRISVAYLKPKKYKIKAIQKHIMAMI